MVVGLVVPAVWNNGWEVSASTVDWSTNIMILLAVGVKTKGPQHSRSDRKGHHAGGVLVI